VGQAVIDVSSEGSPGPSAAVAADEATRTPSERRWAIVGLAALVGLALWQMWPGIGLDYYHYEHVRMDVIRTANPLERMIDPGTTPLPIGWILAMRAGITAAPDSATFARLVSFSSFVVWIGAVYLVLDEIALRRRPRSAASSSASRPAAWWVPVLACACLSLSHVVARQYDYINNYLYEGAYLAIAVLLALRAERSRRAFGGLVAMLAVSPLMLTGGMLAVPALGWSALRAVRMRPPDDRGRGLRALTAGAVVGGVLMVVVYATLWADGHSEPVPLNVQWKEEIAFSAGEVPGLLARTARQVQDGVLGWSSFGDGWLPFEDPGWWIAFSAPIVLGGAVVGLTALTRRWPPYLVIIVSAQVLAIIASMAVDFPMTAVRTNLPWLGLLYAAIAYGLARAAELAGRWIADRLGASQSGAAPAVVAVAACLLAGVLFWHGPRPESPDWFARGFGDDLEPIAQSPAAHNLVVNYVGMTQWYTHDRLVNDGPPGRDYEILFSLESDRDFEYGPLDGLVSDELQPGDALWCVIPYGLSTEFTERACQVDLDQVEPIHQSEGRWTEVRGYLVR
jgi:hypothetical protein